MPQRDPGLRLRDMLDYARAALRFVEGRSRADLDRDLMLAMALSRVLEVIGEAASHVLNDVRGRYPAIPWREIVGLRNRLVHGYDLVDHDILWQIVTRDLSPLVANLERIVRSFEQT